jgi:hypothetical protein
MNTNIVPTPGWIANRRVRENEHLNCAKKRCRKGRRDTVDGAAIWPNRRVGHNTSPQQTRCAPRASAETEQKEKKIKINNTHRKQRRLDKASFDRQMNVVESLIPSK